MNGLTIVGRAIDVGLSIGCLVIAVTSSSSATTLQSPSRYMLNYLSALVFATSLLFVFNCILLFSSIFGSIRGRRKVEKGEWSEVSQTDVCFFRTVSRH